MNQSIIKTTLLGFFLILISFSVEGQSCGAIFFNNLQGEGACYDLSIDADPTIELIVIDNIGDNNNTDWATNHIIYFNSPSDDTEVLIIDIPDENVNNANDQYPFDLTINQLENLGLYDPNSSEVFTQITLHYNAYRSNGNGSYACPKDLTFTIIRPDEISISIPPVNNIITCANTSVDLTLEGLMDPDDYMISWSGPTMAAVTSVSSDGTTATVSEGGTYTVDVTLDGCTATAETIVQSNETEPPIESIKVLDSTIGCSSTTVLLDASVSGGGSYFYEWSSTQNSSNSISVAIAGTYTVTITSADNGCEKILETIITGNKTNPSFDITVQGNTDGNNPALTCKNNTIVLTAEVTESQGAVTYDWGDGSTTDPTLTVTDPGTYTVTITDDFNDCPRTKSITITQNLSPPGSVIITNTSNFTELTCTNTSIILNANGQNNGNFSHEWFRSSQVDPISDGTSITIDAVDANASEIYTLVITRADNGCTGSEEIIITKNTNQPTLDFSWSPGQEITCDNNTVVLNAGNSGVHPDSEQHNQGLTYTLLSSGTSVESQNGIFSVATAGTYVLEIVDNYNGCTSSSDPQIITANGGLPDFDLTGDARITCDNESTLMSATDDPSYTYNWFNHTNNQTLGFSTSAVSFTIAGKYRLDVTDDGNNCTSSIIFDIRDDRSSPDITPINSDPQIDCSNDANNPITLGVVPQSNSTINTEPFTYEWSYDDGSPNDDLLEVFEAGDYTVTVTDENNGCTSSHTITVTSNTILPVATINSGNVTEFNCNQTSILLTAGNQTNSASSYQWSDGGQTGNSSGSSILLEANANQLINETFSVTITANSNNCTDVAEINISSDFSQPTIGNIPDQELNCGLTSVNLDASGSTTGSTPEESGNLMYTWDSALDVGDVPQVTGITTPGNYGLTITNTASNCTDETNIEITQSEGLPTVVILFPDSVTCVNSFITIDASNSSNGNNASMSYAWTTSNGAINPGSENSSQPEVSSAGTYTVTITDNSNGCENTSNVSVGASLTPPTISFLGVNESSGTTPNDGEICLGDGFLLDMTTSGNSYAWSSDSQSNFSSTAQTPFISSSTIGNDGTYTVTVTESSNGCTASDDIDVTINELPNPTIVTNPVGPNIPANTDVTFSCTGCNPGDNYNWTFGNGASISTSIDSMPVVSFGVQGNVSVSLEITSDRGCTASVTEVLTIIVGDDCAVGIIPSENSICVSESVNFSLSYVGSGGAAIDPSKTFWNFDVDNIGGANPSTLTGSNPLSGVTFNNPGTYRVSVSTEDQDANNNGCESTDIIDIVVNNLPTINGLDNLPTYTLACDTPSITLNADLSLPNVTGGLMYEWSTSETTSSINVVEPETYGLTITNTSGCTDETEVTIGQNIFTPNVIIDPPETITCSDTFISLNASSSNNVNEADMSFAWITSDGDISFDHNTSTPTVNQYGTYTVTVQDQSNGCTSSSFVLVEIDTLYPMIEIDSTGLSQNMDGDGIICEGGDFSLDASIQTVGSYLYEWTRPDLANVTNPMLDISNVVMANDDNPNDEGYYNIKVTDSDNGCSSFDSIYVVINPLPEVSLPVTELCSSDKETYQVIFDVSGEAETDTFTIEQIFTNPEDPTDITTTTTYSVPSGEFTSADIPNKYFYEFIITDANGCRPATITGVKICDCDGAFPNIVIEGENSACQGEFNEGTLYTATITDVAEEGLTSITWNIEGGIFIRPGDDNVMPTDSVRNQLVPANSMVFIGNNTYVDFMYVKFTDSGNAKITVTATDIGSCTDPMTEEIPFTSKTINIVGNVNIPSNQKIFLKADANQQDLIMFYAQPGLTYDWGRSPMDDISGEDLNLKSVFPDGTTDSEQQHFHFGESVATADLDMDNWVYWVDVLETGTPTPNCRLRVYYNGPFAFREADIEEYVPVEGFSMDIIPNPNSGEFKVEIESEVFGNHHVQLFDYTGKKIHESSFEKTEQNHSQLISLNSMSQGIYIVNVLDAEGNHKSIKVLIK